MKTHLKASLTFLLIGFILGFFTSFLIFAQTKSPSSKSVIVQKAKELKKSADTIDVDYQNQIDALQDQNIELQQQLEVSTGLLIQAKQDAQEKEDNIKKLLLQKNILPTNDLFQKTNTKHPLKTYLTPKQRELLDYDNLALFSEKKESSSSQCDSLEKEVAEYIEANHRKDRAYEQQLIQFDSLLTNKDAVIETSHKAYADLKLLFDKSIAGQTTLQKENLVLSKQNKGQKFKSKILTGSLFILSGFTANYFIRH
jgi:hypothetical protein